MDQSTHKPLHEQAVAMLISRFGLDERMYFKTGSGWETKLILRRIAIDVIEEKLGIVFVTSSVVGSGKEWGVLMKARLAQSGKWIETVASAGPDTTTFPYRLEIAYKRARHRLVIKMAQLSHLNVFSEDESEEFGETDQSAKRIDGVLKDVPVDMTKPSAGNSLMDEVEKVYGKLGAIKQAALKSRPTVDEDTEHEIKETRGNAYPREDGEGGKAKPAKPGKIAVRRTKG